MCIRPCLLACLLCLASCGGDAVPAYDATAVPAPDLDAGGMIRVAAAPDLGFHHAYYLWWPASPAGGSLLVAPNNTGSTDDDPAVHDRSARRYAANHAGPRLAEPLSAPLLVPTFPRPAARWQIYTHALDRDCFRETEGPLARLDRQLLAMIDHARGILARSGVVLDDRVLLAGFSASGSFVNRFTALHPRRVRAVVAGGLNALPILPLSELDGHELGFPLGVADLDTFDRAAWAAVPQLVFMGALDDNDTLPYGDAWDDDERTLIAEVLGERMQPERWRRVQDLLAASAADIRCVTFAGVGHEITPTIGRDLVMFLESAR